MLAGAYRLPKIERVVFGTPYAQAVCSIAGETGAVTARIAGSRTETLSGASGIESENACPDSVPLKTSLAP